MSRPHILNCALGSCRPLAVTLAALLLSAPSFAAPALPRLRVAPDGRGFVTAAGEPFVPFGINYYRPGTGWAPQVWKQFDPDATRRDFARLRELGGNCVRVFLTYGSFYSQPGRLDEDGLRKLDTFLDLAAEQGIYVHPTGPDHWEGLPDWARTDRIADEKVLVALEDFWRLLANHLRDRTNVFAYDLLNEPEVGWDTPALRARWNGWLTAKYAGQAALTNAWRRADVPVLGEIPPPPREDALLDPRLLDYQHFREDVADEWTRRQVAAIKRAAPDALVTVGLIQWSVPVVLAHVGQYAAFRPSRQAPLLDFVTFHFYPLESGAYLYGGPEAEFRNLAYLDCVARECARFGKPLLVGEFGWHGGGSPRAFRNAPPATEEQQARWCRLLIERTRGLATGWLNWGFHDQPEARDVSEFTGLLKADGTLKAWGREFQRLAGEVRQPAPAVPAATNHPALDWDRLITSRRAVDEFRAAWIAADRPRDARTND